jgi:hypothetical protein
MLKPSRRVTLAIVGVLLTGTLAASAIAGGLPFTKAANPAGYQKFLVYLANGTYDPNDPSYTAPTGEFFQKQIMGRTDAEIAEQRAQALAFFKQRFGLDPANGDVAISMSMFDPRNEYRAYVVGGETVPSTGWVVRDGGFNATVTRDTVLHGTYGGAAGKPVPTGTAVTFGDYNIDRRGPGGHSRPPLLLHYQSQFPISVADQDGVRTFRCELIDPVTGQHGIAQGVIAPPRDAGNGEIQISIRNTLTFPGY